MTAAPAPPGSLSQRTSTARQLLRADPTRALRTLDPIQPARDGSPDADTYREALAVRVVANSMLGLSREAQRDAEAIRDHGSSHASRMLVATWLLDFAGNPGPMAKPLTIRGCGRSGCDHTPAVELALDIIATADDVQTALDSATAFDGASGDGGTFRLAGAGVLRASGRLDKAVRYLEEADEPSLRIAAGLMLYQAGRFAEAAPRLVTRKELFEAASVGANPAAELVDTPSLRAIQLEVAGRWQDAARSWDRAGRRVEAWQARLMAGVPEPKAAAKSTNAMAERWQARLTAGVPEPPPDGVDAHWSWRYYAATGRARPSSEPASGDELRYSTIGRARELIDGVLVGHSPHLGDTELDPYRLDGALDLVAKVRGEPMEAASRLLPLEPPERPRDLLPRLGLLPPPVEWIDATDRREMWRQWIDAYPAPLFPGPRIAQRAQLGKAIEGDSPPSAGHLAALLKGLPASDVAVAAGIAMAKGWRVPSDVGQELVSPPMVEDAINGARRDLLPAVALLAGDDSAPDDLRRTAAEIAGALVALAQTQGDVSPTSGRMAAAVVEDGVAEVAPVDDIIGPFEAYEREVEWLGGHRGTRAGPILAWRARLDARSVNARAFRHDLYGPLGRVRMLEAIGRIEPALRAAANAEASEANRQQVIAGLKVALAERRAAVGDIEAAVALAVETTPAGAEAANAIASEIMDRLEPEGQDAAIRQLERLHEAYASARGVSVALARLLNRRAVTAQRKDKPVSAYIEDMERAYKLDPDSIQVRSNLGHTYLARAYERFETYPEQAIQDVRAAVRVDSNSGELREGASRIAYMCGAVYASRKNRMRTLECLRYAFELDPGNQDVRQALMAIR